MSGPGAVGAQAGGLTLLGASVPADDTSPRTPIPGYLLERGRYTKFDAPDAGLQTTALGINNRGVIVGKYTDGDGVQHGFRRDARGPAEAERLRLPPGTPVQIIDGGTYDGEGRPLHYIEVIAAGGRVEFAYMYGTTPNHE